MKKYFFYAAAAIALASCSNNEFFGDSPTAVGKGHGEISFGTESQNITRGEFNHAEAAKKLNYNFIVYGFKTTGTEDAAGTGDEKVFNLYNVNYTEGTAHTTESNTANWEYVGFEPHNSLVSGITEQTIKYWDYAADSYVFSAISGVGITAEKAQIAENGAALSFTTGSPMASAKMTVNGTATEYDKGWQVTIPAGGSLSDLYASERKPVAKAGYQQTVSLKFYNMGAKIRFALYEIIPGYEVRIDRFYYGSGATATSGSETNFGVDGNFTTLKDDGTDSKLLVTYYPNGNTLENRPKVTPAPGGAKSSTFGEFGTNIQATEAIGTSSPEATYDQASGLFTDIIPMTGNGLTLKVDYTLTSTDGSKETIKVKGATAKVPANFTDWKANFAYTYIFKISDNTNGSTGTDGDGNPVVGLYPITFDAVVVGTEDGIQETITSVEDPSITTYQKGEVVTSNNEYVAGQDIYFENGTADVSSYKVYEVNNFTGNNFETQENMTEQVVANYLNNFCVLTPVDVTLASSFGTPAGIPLSDGTFIPKTGNQAAKFTPVAGKTYAIANGTGQYKLVRVEGTYAAPTFTAATDALGGSTTTASITAIDGTSDLWLSEEVASNTTTTTGVIGAAPSFAVTSSTNKALVIAPATPAVDGKYTVSVDNDAIYAGKANDTYTVACGGGSVTVTVNITNALFASDGTTSLSAASVTAGDATGVTTILKIAGAANNSGVIVNDYEDKGVVVTNTSADGKYSITATQKAVPGVYNITIAGETVAVTVTNYAFAAATYTYNMKSDNTLVESATPVVLNIEAGTAAAAVATGVAGTSLTVPSGLTLTGTDGSYTASATVGGDYTVTYSNTAAKTVVTVKKYAITDGTIARSTGRLELGVTVNNKAVNASAAKVKITKDADGSDQTANFTITANGQKVVLSGAKSTLAVGAYTVHYYLEAGKTNEVATSALTVE